VDFGNGRLIRNVQLFVLVITNHATIFSRDLPKITLYPAVLVWLFASFARPYFYIGPLVGNDRLAFVHRLGLHQFNCITAKFKMKILPKKSFAWFLLILSLSTLLLLSTQPAIAQTDPESTPVNGYPPPATPAQPEDAYPNQPPPTAITPADEAYVAPTTAAVEDANPSAIIGESAPAATAVATRPISQSALVRNRAILWAGFLITLILFWLAVYGAMLMYTRPRN